MDQWRCRDDSRLSRKPLELKMGGAEVMSEKRAAAGNELSERGCESVMWGERLRFLLSSWVSLRSRMGSIQALGNWEVAVHTLESF